MTPMDDLHAALVAALAAAEAELCTVEAAVVHLQRLAYALECHAAVLRSFMGVGHTLLEQKDAYAMGDATPGG